MPIQSYSVLKGDPQSGKVVFNRAGKNPHYRIELQAGDGLAEVDVNIQSEDGSEVLYFINTAFTPPDGPGLTALAMGINPLDSAAGGLALDFVRETINGAPMVDQASMTLLPKTSAADSLDNHLQNAVVALLDQAIQDQNGTIYAFGSVFGNANGRVGIHDIHMNQGNPSGSHDADNGTWQDGALFINLPGNQDQWIAVFLAFQTQSWQTDDNGNVAG